MTLSAIFYIVYLSSVIIHLSEGDTTKHVHCDGHQTNYAKNDVMGTWYVVAVIPGPELPRLRHVACYETDFSETDEAGVRWLVSKIDNSSPDFINNLTGTIIRQRFYAKKPYDIWSKEYYNTSGCFRQLLSLETNNTNVVDSENYDNYMQLHIVNTNDSAGPYLVQLLWGRISAVIYRRAVGVSPERLEPINKFLTKMRGHQLAPRICDSPF